MYIWYIYISQIVVSNVNPTGSGKTPFDFGLPPLIGTFVANVHANLYIIYILYVLFNFPLADKCKLFYNTSTFAFTSTPFYFVAKPTKAPNGVNCLNISSNPNVLPFFL